MNKRARLRRAIVYRITTSLAILLVIAYLTLLGLIVAERGKAGLPAQPAEAALEAARRTLDYVVNHPATYHWQRQDTSAPGLVLALFGRSAVLLLTSLGMAALAGVPLGIAAALLRRLRAAPLVLLFSVLGISTPSFLLAMLFWIVNVRLYHLFGLKTAPLPPTGFGWDAHLVMPALVLATRPLAQIVQVTYVALSDVMGEDYIRTARAKGLGQRVIINRHALRNILIPVLTTLGTSLRFSLASLPVVEVFFLWPGVGFALLQAIEVGLAPLVTDLIVSLGFLFLLINLGLEAIYQLLDPRLRENHHEAQQEEKRSWRERWGTVRDALANLVNFRAWILDFRRFRRRPAASSPQPQPLQAAPGEPPALNRNLKVRQWLHVLRIILGNLPLLLGTLLVAAFVYLSVYGEKWAQASPYETHGVMVIEGAVNAPPFSPSNIFPWGSDAVGRDIQALVLAGAKQTLSLALLAMLARLAVGAVLGVLSGWWRSSWLDRLVNGAVAVWAAFPITLFAMILILALGIKQGMNVFVAALCVVGWGEVAQFMRGQVLSLKPRLYIEAARSVGARTGWILMRHILPHLWGPLVVLAVLEMGSVLMLLAELGFLNVFLGGGFKAEIGEVGKMVPVIYYFSDVPEWGALLANIRQWWRSYPWLAWYPGVAFFLAILAFNLWGEGLRRFLEDSRVNIGRLINRYTVIAAGVIVFGGGWLIRSTAPLEMYRSQAGQFDVQRAMQNIQTLASPQFEGRESGMPGARAAAEYIAAQMQDIGLSPAGGQDTFIHAMAVSRFHLAGTPRMEILSAAGQAAESFVYRKDFVEHVRCNATGSERQGTVVGLVAGPSPGEMGWAGLPSLGEFDLRDHVLLVREADLDRLEEIFNTPRGLALILRKINGLLAVADDPSVLERKYIFPGNIYPGEATALLARMPVMFVTPQTAGRLLAGSGSGLAQLDALAQGLQPGQLALTGEGARVNLAMPTSEAPDGYYYHVMGFIPGAGALLGEQEGEGLDSNVVIVSAYYDGLGMGPDGTFYPGANDNASGVAAMLEIARVLKASSSQPRKTVVFAAWSGGERREGFSVVNVMSARPGFNLLTVEAVIELSGVGAGSGRGIALGQATSFSMVQLFQDAARRVGAPVTTRGRDPHYDIDTQSGFGGRSALSAYVSWDGADQAAHTAGDTFEAIDPKKLEQVGQTTLLAVSVLVQAESQQSAMGPLAPPTHYVEAARMFDEKQALEHIRYLASDELEGRRPGTPGGRAAGDYIAARFAEYGLQPAGAEGAYFQPFSVPYTTVVTAPVLSMAFPGGGTLAPFTRAYTDHIDYWPRISDYMGSGDGEGPAFWLDDCRDSHFAGQNLAGKIVLCYHSNLTNYEAMIAQALAGRVKGILLATDFSPPLPRSAYASTQTAPIPIFYVARSVAEDMLTGTDYTLDALERERTFTPLSTTVRMVMGVAPQRIEARNVLGVLPGSDPDYGNQIVVVGANYDGLGRDPDGKIYNGAFANASGVAAMLEIARMWREQGYRPARSVLFAAWDDEEQGWFGSKYYVQHPSYPLDRTVANLNLQMVGRGDKLYLFGLGAVADQIQSSARVYSVTLNVPIPAERSLTWGDALPFFKAGVPAAMVMFSESPATGVLYHLPSDDAENIQLIHLRTVGVMAAHALAAWGGGGPTLPLPPDIAPQRTLRDLILPTPICPTPWPMGSMTCDHGHWTR